MKQAIKWFMGLAVPGGMALWLIGIAVVGSFIAGWTVREWRADSEKADIAAAQNKLWIEQVEKHDAAAEDAQGKAKDLETKLATLRRAKELGKAKYENPVYRDCVLPPDGVQSLNNAIAGINAARAAR